MPQHLNRLLPDDLRVGHLRKVSPLFSVRLHATSREYSYSLGWGYVPDPLKRRYQGFVYGDLDVPAMTGAIEAMVGTHDFAAFSNLRHDKTPTVRTITKAQLVRSGSQEAQIQVRNWLQWPAGICTADACCDHCAQISLFLGLKNSQCIADYARFH